MSEGTRGGEAHDGVEEAVRALAAVSARRLRERMDARDREMEEDDRSHTLVYRVLGVGFREGVEIDRLQNRGRFLYKYAGAFLEEATLLCFQHRFPEARPVRVPNRSGPRPRTFQVDCLAGDEAIEVKWRDATTDGDHVLKERARVQAIVDAGYVPVRIMYFYPNREQAIRIQQDVEALYIGNGGRYHHGAAAWDHVRERTGVDLKAVLGRIAGENAAEDASGTAPR